MTLDKIIPSLLETLHTEDLDIYIVIISEGYHVPFAAIKVPDHPYWSSDECFALYEDLLKTLNGMVDLEELLNDE